MTVEADTATLVTAGASAVYAAVSAVSLWLLSQQVRDARRFGAVPALYALLKELDDHLAALRRVDGRAPDDPEAREVVARCLEFFERVEHLRGAGVLSTKVLRRAFGGALAALVDDPRFAAAIRRDARQHAEVLALAARIGGR